ncbi:2-oxoacid:acceptor oxidoreductase family protein [Methylobacter sp. YRD-M1]|uniref:2-oxoacid:acceptor oxidoreductase family protein n=1 Tax=Methylobacter sp. YRD-M1 TaxID=2911520 RepID=UPI00227A8631|nr:2-oxoacid:acceptor oxidoreductase family protein [Methylobacter sp. YRD-M1]WAK01412.1 2-oxoacid:acceptor oxidoreductase family protein [Methylobacter sp. YRD-M1]
MAFFGKKETKTFKYPGIRMAMDGSAAVIMVERESSDAAGAYPITPSTDMGEGWAVEMANGYLNISDRPLIFVEPEGEHAAAGVTAGMSMTGLRATNFTSSQGAAYMHESLYAAVGKRLPYVLNMACRAITKSTLNVHCGHDDYHCIDDTGFIQVFAKDNQEAADLNIIGRKIAELSLNPIVVAQDGFLTTHLIEALNVPERALIEEYLGRPDDIINTPTPAQRIIYGPTRRRIPELWTVDKPMMSGVVQNQDSYMQAVAGQRPYFFDHVSVFADECMDEWYELTGRRYRRIGEYRCDDADYLIIAQGSVIHTAEVTADYLREKRGIKVGVVNMTMFRPFPGDLISHVVRGRKGVTVMERTDQPMAEDLPLIREIRTAMAKAVENGTSSELPFPGYATYKRDTDSSPLYSASFGLGSRDLQPEGIIAAVENMLPNGKHQKFFYLGIQFVRDQAYSPKQEIQQQAVVDAYPRIRDLALTGSENPNLMPEGAITVRMHSVGGWGAITTGKNLAMTLFDLLDYEIKANPKYGSEKKGQPTTYYLSAAPEKIRLACEYAFVDVVISPDPNVFTHSNPLAGLKANGVFIIQSSLSSPEEVWRSFPKASQRYIVDKKIKVAYIDAFKIAREEAKDPDLQFRMQGIAFQGAFFEAAPLAANLNKSKDEILQAIYDTLNAKFGSKGKQVVEDNFRTVKRGFLETHEIDVSAMAVGDVAPWAEKKEATAPLTLLRKPANDDALSDIHRFFEQTGSNYINGRGSENLADPFMALSIVPAATGIYRDMTQIRFEHPTWIPENCTACGDCYTVCPDSAIPGLINTVGEVFETNIKRIEKNGKTVKHLRRAIRTVEKKYHALAATRSEGTALTPVFNKAIGDTIAEYPEAERAEVSMEFEWFKDAMGPFKFALTKPYHDAINKRTPNNGGLFSITINPMACKGCMECVKVCNDNALAVTPQTIDSIKALREDWDYWMDLPTSNPKYNRIDDIDEKVGALTSMLLDKKIYSSMNCGDGACLGCGEKTIIHLFTSAVTAMMQPRVKKQIAKIDSLIVGMEKHIRLKLAESLDINDIEAIEAAIEANKNVDLTLAKLSSALDAGKPSKPIDAAWLKWASQISAKLKHLKWLYLEGPTGNGRVEMGITNSTGCTSVWGSTFPFNPYPFPWANHLFQDAPSLAMGVFEGHMLKMAEGFKAIRMAELELAGKYDNDEHERFFKYFDWRQFTEQEYLMCPPVVCVGGDGAMYDIGFQNLSRCLISGLPIKVLILDTQVYSNTGGQACTSGFTGQISDMAPYGQEAKGKFELRKEMSLLAMAHRTSYVMQGAISHVNHLLEGYIDGLNFRGPAVFNIYAVCQPEHGVADDASEMQSRLAVESRAYPLLTFDPRMGNTWEECTSIQGNPDIDKDWTTYTLKFVDEYGLEDTLEVPMTFADWALTEGRFRKHFKFVPPSQWTDDMVPLVEFIDLPREDKAEYVPFIHAVHPDTNTLVRVAVDPEIVLSTIDRRDFWRTLKGLVGANRPTINLKAIADQAKAEMASSIAANLVNMAGGGDASALTSLLTQSAAAAAPVPVAAPAEAAPAPTATPAATAAPAPKTAAGGHESVWIETPNCTTCDECVDIAPAIFQYNAEKKAVVVNPTAGTYEQIVKAAEKCTAVIIHPGTPWNPDEPNLEKLIKRAEKFQ